MNELKVRIDPYSKGRKIEHKNKLDKSQLVSLLYLPKNGILLLALLVGS